MHVNPYERFQLDMTNRLDLDAVAPSGYTGRRKWVPAALGSL
jgi:hypothetical protein